MQKEGVLKAIAKRLRYLSLDMTTKKGSGHPTTCLSMADFMACLFFDEMRFDPKNPDHPNNDQIVLSKGHAAPILWASFAEAGIISHKALDGYRTLGSVLEGHPTPRMHWIKAATGSLGQGLSIGLGMALGAVLQKSSSRIFVILGDGECAEGSVWEAAALADKYKTSNLVAILDTNRLGQSGESLHGHDISRWVRKFSAFGWNVFVIDGHDIKAILNAFADTKKVTGPSVIIAKTLKGKGISFLEDKEGWHGKALKKEEFDLALSELGAIPRIDSKKFTSRPPKFNYKKSSRKSLKLPSYRSGEMVATREAYGTALANLSENSDSVALDGDVKNSTFAEKFKSRHAERFFDCFIAEQNMAGMAAGLAARGFVPFASTFAAFWTRSHDQIRMSGISGANVKFVGSHVGVSIGEDGASQMGLEDLSLFRSIPESVILYPGDAVSCEKCTELLYKSKGIGYLRVSRPKSAVIYKNSESFKIGGSKVLRKSKNDRAVVIAAGVTVHEALKAYDVLKKKGVSVKIIDAYSVKPLDSRTILKECAGKRTLVVEDHYREGGLGEAVAALGIPISHLAVCEIPHSGKPEELLKKYRIDSESIIKEVLRK